MNFLKFTKKLKSHKYTHNYLIKPSYLHTQKIPSEIFNFFYSEIMMVITNDTNQLIHFVITSYKSKLSNHVICILISITRYKSSMDDKWNKNKYGRVICELCDDVGRLLRFTTTIYTYVHTSSTLKYMLKHLQQQCNVAT